MGHLFIGPNYHNFNSFSSSNHKSFSRVSRHLVCKTKFSQLVDSYLKTSSNVTDFIDQHLKLIVHSTKKAGLFKEGDNLRNLHNAWRLGGNLHTARYKTKHVHNYPCKKLRMFTCKTIGTNMYIPDISLHHPDSFIITFLPPTKRI